MLLERNKKKKQLEEARNKLESYIYNTQEKLDEKYVLDVSLPEERDTFRTKISEISEWLELANAEAKTGDYQRKLSDLQRIGNPMFFRVIEQIDRPNAVEHLRMSINFTRMMAQSFNETKPQISENETNNLLQLCDSYEKWLEEKEAEQEMKKKHEEPAFYSREVDKKSKDLEKETKKLLMKPPLKKPKNATFTDRNTNSTNYNNTNTKDQAKTENQQNREPDDDTDAPNTTPNEPNQEQQQETNEDKTDPNKKRDEL